MPKRYLSSLLLRLNGRLVLVDCGEGTQVTLKELGWGFKHIDSILFTHYHADHISGLPGMLLTIGNAGREEPLKLIGPKGLIYVVEGLLRISPELPFSLEFEEIEEEHWQQDIGPFHMKAQKVEHTVTCYAYCFEVRRKGKFDINKAMKLGLPQKYWSLLQKGETVWHEGKEYTGAMVMGIPRRGIKLTYCTDSRPTAGLVRIAEDSDLLICEGMYGEEEKKEKAIANRHMLFSEAAETAKLAKAKRLWLTHYSPSLSDPQVFLDRATSIFENTQLGYDRLTDTLRFLSE